MQLTYTNTASTTTLHDESVPTITFPVLQSLPWLRHGFSTRLGGVSEGHCSSMNLSFTRGDREDAVQENFRRIGQALRVQVSDMILSDQTHTANVLFVDDSKKGMGILRERDFQDIDGMITNVPGVCLVTSHADCVPVYFVDPVRHAIGLSHAGWKGTLHNIAQNTVSAMQERFGTNPADLLAVIGPSICRSCYEISADVADQFAEVYGPAVFDRILTPEVRYLHTSSEAGDEAEPVQGSTKPPLPFEIVHGKFLLDLWEANRVNLLRAGVPADHITTTDLCTCCNPLLFHSHRASKGQRGGQCAFLQLTL